MNAADTNVLIYCLDLDEPVKRAKAIRLLRQLRKARSRTVLLWQVAGEFTRYLRTKQHQTHYSSLQVRQYLDSVRRHFPLVMPTPAVLDRALDLGDQHSLSHWDSMLVAACLEAGVTTLHTEDMGAPRVIESLRLENPFI